MIFTIEPMINLGKPHVKVLSDGWTAVTRDRSLSAQYEHAVGVTATGCEIFTLSPGGFDRPGLPPLSPHKARPPMAKRPASPSADLSTTSGFEAGEGDLFEGADERGFLQNREMRPGNPSGPQPSQNRKRMRPIITVTATGCGRVTAMAAMQRLPITSCWSFCCSD